LKDAVHNVSRAAMMVATLISGRQEFLRLSLEDHLHQPYRSKLITGYDELMEYFVTQEFLGSFISGAGPTVIAMAEKDQWFGELVFKDWRVEKLNIDHEGARVIQL
jgi:homoserine kinase